MRASSFDVIYIPEKMGIYGITLFYGNIPMPNRCACKDAPSPLKKDFSSSLFTVVKYLKKLKISETLLFVLSFFKIAHFLTFFSLTSSDKINMLL